MSLSLTLSLARSLYIKLQEKKRKAHIDQNVQISSPSMAVEAHHLHRLLPNREIASTTEAQPSTYNPYMAFLSPSSAAAAAPFYNIPASAAAAAVSESGVTFNNFASPSPATAISRKRPRDTAEVSFLGEDISAHVQQQLLDIDRVVLHHAEKVRVELAERRRRFSRQVMAAVETAVAKRLKLKDDEIERIGKLNWALEERVRSLYVECQIWREMAQTNEAAANALRANLDQVLEAQAVIDRKKDCGNGGDSGDASDAESCCCGENEEAAASLPKACATCGEAEAAVLLLPCRHLCACAACAAAAPACPVCGCGKNGSVSVNLC